MVSKKINKRRKDRKKERRKERYYTAKEETIYLALLFFLALSCILSRVA